MDVVLNHLCISSNFPFSVMCLYRQLYTLLFTTIVNISGDSLNVPLIVCQKKTRRFIGLYFPMVISSCTGIMDQGIVLRAL